MVNTKPFERLSQFGDSTRGQAFTLEAVISGLIVLTAVLFAVQSTVVTPNSTGGVDTDTRDRLGDQTKDVLAITADQPKKNLSYLVRYWNDSSTERTFAGAKRPEIGYGMEKPPAAFGDRLEASFRDEGYNYNVVLTYQTPKPEGAGEIVMVYRGTPDAGAVTTVYPVTLFDSDTLTGPSSTETSLENISNQIYPIEDVAKRSPIYNVVEVRITVW